MQNLLDKLVKEQKMEMSLAKLLDVIVHHMLDTAMKNVQMVLDMPQRELSEEEEEQVLKAFAQLQVLMPPQLRIEMIEMTTIHGVDKLLALQQVLKGIKETITEYAKNKEQ